ncbi:hypothetical protein RchiOBHm_Chr7g0222991 [Rosa chinensis]|uniref:Uncharacterized protein n=1 Tax=Rosa chinensis TaxID=74649 RepID=A0A2P6PDF5_ROSCH|nr:hypothetical protein RchiOBHm_Chr7g0222991 [Rosa chinensis]
MGTHHYESSSTFIFNIFINHQSFYFISSLYLQHFSSKLLFGFNYLYSLITRTEHSLSLSLSLTKG